MSNMGYKSGRATTVLRRGASLGAIVGLMLGGSTTALPLHAEEGGQYVGDVIPQDATVFYTFPGFPQIAISRQGNIVRYEGPPGFEHIGVGAFSEGYVLCYGPEVAYDVAGAASGFGPASTSCSQDKCTVARSTADRKLQLKQVFTKNAPERSLNIDMTVKNLTGSGIAGVVLRRQVDFDVDAGGSKGTNDFANWFGASEPDSAFAWNGINAHAAEDHAMLIKFNKTPGTIRPFAKVTADILDSSCDPVNIAADGPVQGDYGATVQYNIGTLAGGASVIVPVQYQRN